MSAPNRTLYAGRKWRNFAIAALGPERDWPPYVRGHIYQSLIENVATQIELAVRSERAAPTPDNAYVVDDTGNQI